MKENKMHVWSCENEKDFYPSREVYTEIPSGFYSVKFSQEYGVYISKIKDKQDETLDIISSSYKKVKKDFDKFWSLEKKYKEYGLQYSRRVLLYGHPGNGKKYIAKRIANHFLQKHNGLVLYFEDVDDVKKAIRHIKEIEPNRKILVVMENVGILLEKFGIPAVASILKDISSEDNLYIISTTNHEERVSEYISDKPNMFDLKLEIGYPTLAERKKYIKTFISKVDVSDSEKGVETIAEDTDGLSLGYIRNLLESYFIYNYDYDKKLEEANDMKENIMNSYYPDDSKNGEPGIGF